MPSRFILSLPLWIVILSLSAACAPFVGQQSESDPRLDQLMSKADQSLVNQTEADALLREYGRQLESQQREIQRLGNSIAPTLAPVAAECSPVQACPEAERIAGKTVVGGLESIWMSDLGFALAARIDTGADTSVLSVRNVELFERDGKRWVRFNVVNPVSGESVLAERRVQRMVGMVQTVSGKTRRRPLVQMRAVIGPFAQTVEFILSERTHNGYQAQIGRSVLNDVIVVDVSRKNIAPYARLPTSSETAQ